MRTSLQRKVNILSEVTPRIFSARYAGKELKELMKKMSGAGKESGSEEEGGMEAEEDTEPTKLKVDKTKSGQ